ncbi:hypothetical protein ATG_13130 [Desulfurococcaceae archaeon AG1]|nr:hypothetical protein ATG_13130 [Desulfurococcaceae archaeon AG1]
MRLVKIRLSCEDNPACIEYVYRIECKSKELCDRLREEIKREYIGE